MKKIIQILCLCISFYSLSQSKTFEDMLGTKIEIKNEIKKIHASTPILLYSLYIIDKEKIAGLNFPFNQGEAQYLDEKIVNLPVLGGWFGQGRTPNSEMILQVNPDVILLSDFTKKMGEEKIKASLGHINVPLVYLKSNTLEEMIESFLYIGQLVNQESRANTLARYAQESLDLAKAISKEVFKKPKVYYAEGKNGLQTECHSSIHSELIHLAVGENVHKCEAKNQFGRQTIHFEQLLGYNPEIILVFEKEFYSKIYQDAKWQHIDAVKNKRVYFLPKGPFSWFDRPPSFMRILGLKWLLSIFHPQLYQIDIHKEAKNFYKLFLELELTDAMLDDIMGKKL